MTRLKILFTVNYWKYIFSIRKTVNAILGTFGIIWLLVEATSFFSNNISQLFKENWEWLLIIGAVWIIYENWPKVDFCYKLKDRDIRIQISIGNLFDYKGHLVIPVNTSFDTSFDNGLIAKSSTQGQFTIRYFKEPRYFDQDIINALRGEVPILQLPDKVKGNKFRYEIGKVLKIELENDKYAYLSASSDMNNNGVSSTTFDNILISLGSLWDFVSTKGESGEISIPVLGTGRGRIIESRETVIKAIVHSFISATSTGKRFCDKLNIVIHPKDFADHQIDINELCDFLKLKCKHYKHDTNTKGIGQGIG